MSSTRECSTLYLVELSTPDSREQCHIYNAIKVGKLTNFIMANFKTFWTPSSNQGDHYGLKHTRRFVLVQYNHLRVRHLSKNAAIVQHTFFAMTYDTFDLVRKVKRVQSSFGLFMGCTLLRPNPRYSPSFTSQPLSSISRKDKPLATSWFTQA